MQTGPSIDLLEYEQAPASNIYYMHIAACTFWGQAKNITVIIQFTFLKILIVVRKKIELNKREV